MTIKINVTFFLCTLLAISTTSCANNSDVFPTETYTEMLSVPMDKPCLPEVVEQLNITKQKCAKKIKDSIAHCRNEITTDMPQSVNKEQRDRILGRMVVCKTAYLLDGSYSNERADEFFSGINKDKH